MKARTVLVSDEFFEAAADGSISVRLDLASGLELGTYSLRAKVLPSTPREQAHRLVPAVLDYLVSTGRIHGGS